MAENIHGMMWIAYGVGMVLAYLLGVLIGDEEVSGAIFIGVVIGGIPAMIAYHHWLKRKYYINR